MFYERERERGGGERQTDRQTSKGIQTVTGFKSSVIHTESPQDEDRLGERKGERQIDRHRQTYRQTDRQTEN